MGIRLLKSREGWNDILAAVRMAVWINHVLRRAGLQNLG